ncbi:MAG: phospholipid carrier-dependent glycosyltransferase [Anaerolineales bacterium]|nr:phospholipid carrier-dependent glycosyltransferase [Anaerolineales bacterium]
MGGETGTIRARSGRARGGVWPLLGAVVALIVLWAQALGGSSASSVTFDEPYHLGAGYAYLRTGDVRLSSDHPPLIDAWAALPLLLMDLDLPLDSPTWALGEYGLFGDVFLWQANPDRVQQIVWLGRLPILALAMVLAAAVFRWVSSLAGRLAGLLALTLVALDPGIVAHSSLATNDLGVAAVVFLAVWAWWRWLEQPSAGRLVLAGLLAGAACVSKYSGLIVGPIAVALAIGHRPSSRRVERIWARRAAGLIGVGLIAVFTIWAVYGFTVQGGLPAPTFWKGIAFQGNRLVNGQPTYALGRVWPGGVWFYYPLALLVKTPLPVMILALGGLIVAVRRRAWQVLTALGLPGLLFTAAVGASALQLGHRFLLPLLPFVASFGGIAGGMIVQTRRRGWRRAATAGIWLLVGWLGVNAICIYPHHLSFFNELAGGPQHADQYLVDANLDWGQDLPALGQLMDEQQIPFVHLGYFGSAVPDVYGIRYWPAPSFLRFIGEPESMAFNPYTPHPGWYAISRTSLRQGLVWTHPDLYAVFRSQSPAARAGYSINLYRVEYPAEMPVVRALVQGERVADVPAERLGWRDGERLIVKWTPDANSFVLAMSGPATYLASDPLPYAPDVRDVLLGAARQTGDGSFEADVRDMMAPVLTEWAQASSLWTPTGTALSAPVDFAGGLHLVGYRLAQSSVSPGESIALVLIWQVAGDLRPPLASFVHLIDQDGVPRAQVDGWGTAIQGLEQGDVIVHSIQIPVSAEVPAGTYRLQTGLYSPDTAERWIAETAAGPFDRVWLAEMEVR